MPSRSKAELMLELSELKAQLGAHQAGECNVEAMNKLRESEEKFSLFFHTSPNILIISTIEEGTILDINDAGVKTLGLTKEEMLNKTTLELGLLKPEDRASFLEAFQEQGPPTGIELPVYLPDGQELAGMIHSQVILLDGQECLFHTVHDISKQKKTEQVLLEQAETIRSIVETSRDWIWAIDLQGVHTYSNAAIEDILGYQHSEMVGISSFDLMHETDRKTIQAMLPNYIRYQQGWHGLVIRWKHKDGSWRYLESNAVPIINENGEVAGFRGVDRDITERRKAAELVRQAYDATLEGWAKMLEMRDRETEGHSQRAVELTVRMAEAVGLEDEKIVHIRRGALLHDIGKMGVPDSILQKPGKLTEEEWVIMKRHPALAYESLSNIPFLQPALDIPYCHHEKWDGSGYPRGLKGEEIPVAARIFALIDVFDALSNDRVYAKAWPREEVLNYIEEQSGAHFDPALVPVFLDLQLSP